MDLHGAGTASRVIAAPESTRSTSPARIHSRRSNLLPFLGGWINCCPACRTSGSGSETFTINSSTSHETPAVILVSPAILAVIYWRMDFTRMVRSFVM